MPAKLNRRSWLDDWKTALLATDVLPGGYYPNYTIVIAAVSFLIIAFFVAFFHRKKLKIRRQSRVNSEALAKFSMPIFIASIDTVQMGSRNNRRQMSCLDSPDFNSRMTRIYPEHYFQSLPALESSYEDITHANPHYHSDASLASTQPSMGSLMSLVVQNQRRLPPLNDRTRMYEYQQEQDSANMKK
jgi:hypothetical protein